MADSVTSGSTSVYPSFVEGIAALDQYNARLLVAEDKVETYTYTATSTISNIIHNLTYNSSHDELFCYYEGVLMKEGSSDNYINNINGISIDLVGWTLNEGEVINFVLYKNIK